MTEPLQLTFDEFWQAFMELEEVYPRTLPLTLWRAWELAIYRKFQPVEPLLDLGCGDGRFLRLLWPDLGPAVGVDIDAQALERARQTDVYHETYLTPAHQIPLPDASFKMIFSNCAMEHMSHIEGVAQEAARLLEPGGVWLFSVVTNYFLEWMPIPSFLKVFRLPWLAGKSRRDYIRYHHLVNPFTVEQWVKLLEQNGFVVQQQITLAPDIFARAFLIMDHLWHVPWHRSSSGYLDQHVWQFLQSLPNFYEGIHDILRGVWKLSRHDGPGIGLIVYARKEK